MFQYLLIRGIPVAGAALSCPLPVFKFGLVQKGNFWCSWGWVALLSLCWSWGTGRERGVTLERAGFHCCSWEGSEFTVGEARPCSEPRRRCLAHSSHPQNGWGINWSKPSGVTVAVGTDGASTVGLTCTP